MLCFRLNLNNKGVRKPRIASKVVSTKRKFNFLSSQKVRELKKIQLKK